jgi:type II secretory pathway pseudopilin PulG
MELVGLILGILGIAVTIAIAYWQHKKAEIAEARLESLAAHLPGTLLDGVQQVLASQVAAGTDSDDGWVLPGSGSADSPWLKTRYADLNGDGTDELLIEAISGPHSSVLLVYGLRNWEFEKLAELHSTTINGFHLQRSDNDGRLEVETVEIAKPPGLPYVFGLRDKVTYRLVGNAFEEFARVEGWDETDLERIRLDSDRQHDEQLSA